MNPWSAYNQGFIRIVYPPPFSLCHTERISLCKEFKLGVIFYKLRHDTMKSILLAILSGLLLILSFPRYDIGYLAWLALVPLLIAIKDRSMKSSFGICLITGILFYGGVFYWFSMIKVVSWIDFISVVMYLSLFYYGLFGLGFNFLSTKTRLPGIVVAPVLWIILEYARSYAGFLSHPQMLMGHSQYLNLSVIQISAFTGTYGVSFLIIMVNIAISDIIHDYSKACKPFIMTVLILAISLIYGFGVIAEENNENNISVTVVQGNISHGIKWRPEFRKQHVEKHVLLTRKALRNTKNTSLIVWPETAIEGSLKNDAYYLETLSTLAKDSNSYILFGSSQNPKYGSEKFRNEKRFNSAFIISPAGCIEGQYNKIYLLPFAEYLPYKGYLPWPSKYVSRASNLIPGTEYTIFNLGIARFGTIICWESLYPEIFRRFVKKGANFMVNITNESQLGDTASYQFAAISVFRAVENRISIARAANTGISCFISPCGKIMGRVCSQNGEYTCVEGYLTKNVPLSHKKTFYTKYGDVFAYMNMFVAVIFVGVACVKRK